MRQLSEFAKLLIVLRFLFSSIFSAILKNDSNAKRFITGLYLTALSNKARIPSKVVSVDDSDTYKISAHIYADMNAPVKDRFILMEVTDILPLLALIHRCKPKRIFEFGLMKGGSLTHFFLNTPSNVTIDSVDINIDNLTPFVRNMIAEHTRVKVHNQNSLHFDADLFSGQMDFVFIDGGHDYEIVKNDTLKAMKMLSPNGMIVWDDYNPAFPGVFAFVNEFAKQQKDVFHVKGSKLACWQRTHSQF